MGKKLLTTPRSKIRAALRQLFLRSREHGKTLKDAGYCCARCGVKKSVAKGKEVKVEVHHKGKGIDNWSEIIDAIYAKLLNQDDMEVLCVDCHKKETEAQNRLK